ncbi:MAG TPA: deoxyribodipyrimidine photo-lyase [Candidatus Polarisedimenticolaceae bacterium]|nr:deoxyribodipyrimidine photo-lyase [Candidatus Polarisedimenticolaceae bacterium]
MHGMVWFRSDLRLRDNTALDHACRRAERVSAVFLTAPEQWREHDWGATKVDFVMRNVRELASSLAERGIALHLLAAPRFADAPAVLVELMREQGCGALFFNREHEVNERRRDRAVRVAVEAWGAAVEEYDDQTILAPDRVRTKTGGFYRVFGPYRRAWLEELDRGSRPTPRGLPAHPASPPVDRPRLPRQVAGYGPSPVPAGLWPAGEREARRRLDAFVAGAIDRYHVDRDFPAVDGTSALSPYLAVGAVSARQCLAAASDANTGWVDGGRPGVAAWIGELVWREFYRHVLVGFPRVSKNRPFRSETDEIEWRDDDESFRRWAAGATGVPIVDAAMRQLHRTGWMHNRLRMVVAMYLTKHLLLDWRRGERHFMERLIDGDLANNNGGWQWSASTGCDAAPYFRIFNPVRQSRRFDPQGRFILRFCPELRDLSGNALHDPSILPAERRARLDYPPALVDHRSARARAIAAFHKLASSPRVRRAERSV